MKEKTEKYVDLGPVDNSLPTGLAGVNQEQLMAFVEGLLEHHKTQHPKGSRERAAYEASIGMMQRSKPSRLRRFLGWLRQRRWTKRLLAIERGSKP